MVFLQLQCMKKVFTAIYLFHILSFVSLIPRWIKFIFYCKIWLCSCKVKFCNLKFCNIGNVVKLQFANCKLQSQILQFAILQHWKCQNADVTFSFNFCSHCAQLTIEWFISVGPLYRSLFLMGGKASTFKWCQIMMVGDEKSQLTAKATHPCYTEQETSNIFLRHQGCGWCYTVCCKTVILWLGCHGNSISWVSHVPVQHVIPVAAH